MLSHIYDVDFYLFKFLSFTSAKLLFITNTPINNFIFELPYYNQIHNVSSVKSGDNFINASLNLIYLLTNDCLYVNNIIHIINIIKQKKYGLFVYLYEHFYDKKQQLKILLNASQFGCVDVLCYLQSKGVDIRMEHDEAIRLALINGQLDIVKYLHTLSVPLIADQTVLYSIVKNEFLDILKYIIKNLSLGSTKCNSIILHACKHRRFSIVKYMSEHCKKNNISIEANTITEAVLSNNIEIVKYLHNTGIDLFACSYALLYSCQYGYFDIVKYFNKNGLYIKHDRIDKYDNEFVCATRNNHLEIVEYLFNNDPNAHKFTKQALIIASQNGNIKIVEYLHRVGVNIGIQNNAAIRVAAGHGHLKIVQFLYNKGANIKSYNNTAIINAAKHGHYEVVRYLHSVGADICAQNSSALCYAAEGGYLEIVKYLHNYGSLLTTYDYYAIKAAYKNNHTNVVEYLLQFNKNK